MRNTDFNKQFLEEFPELKAKFDKAFPYPDKMETGKHVTIEQIWWPSFRDAIEKSNSSQIAKYCDYVDKLFSQDEDCQNVVLVSIIENLADKKIDITKFQFKPENMKIYINYYNNF